MKKAYYARCQSLYGTHQEGRDIALIEGIGYEVIPFPDQADILRLKKLNINVMELVFQPLVLKADILIFRALPHGPIPAGVGQEIEWALEADMPIIELPNALTARRMTIEDTREYLRDVGQR